LTTIVWTLNMKILFILICFDLIFHKIIIFECLVIFDFEFKSLYHISLINCYLFRIFSKWFSTRWAFFLVSPVNVSVTRLLNTNDFKTLLALRSRKFDYSQTYWTQRASNQLFYLFISIDNFIFVNYNIIQRCHLLFLPIF
jgi:hypothetical protein